MAEPQRIELVFLGTKLTVRTEASPEYLQSLVRDLEEAVAQLRRSGVRDDTTALMLAALDVSDELFREREDKQRNDGDVGARLGNLLTLLEQAVPNPSRPGAPSLDGT
jgi:cell division protein ZapA (FtsZ GTPase activity inhibitor)